MQATCRSGGRPAGKQPALPGPDDGFAAAMHAQFGIDRRDMIANGVERQIEARRDFLVRQPLANQFQHIALARREIAGVKSGLIGPVDAFHVGQFFNQGLAEPEASCITSSMALTSSSSERLRSVMSMSTSR